MKNIKLIQLFLILSVSGLAQQAPVANFSIGPQPVCSGQVVQITDLSSGSPTSWSYTVSAAGPGGPSVLSGQNPTLSFNFQGTYTITQVVSNSSGTSAPVTHTVQVFQSPNGNINPATQNSCIGGNPINIIVLTGGGGGGSNTYSWSTGATGNSITVSPSVTTIYNCVITSTNGCSTVRSSTINIVTPTVNITSSPVNICPGSSSTLNATISGPGPNTYTWSTGSNTTPITVSVAGVYDVTVTSSNGCTGTQSYSISVSNSLVLNVTSTPSTLCAGNTATLHVSGGSAYLWDFNSANPNPTVNPITATVYSVVGTAGTCSGSAVFTLQVSQIPTISVQSSTTSICAGNSVSLSASGANTYTWLPGNANTNSIVVTPSVSTTYTVRGVNPGCAARNGSVLVTVNPSPILQVSSSSSLACNGDVVALVANGANTYTWSTGSNNPILIVTASPGATYSLVGSNAFNCVATTNYSLNVQECTGIKENSEFGSQVLTVYPNPNTGNFSLFANASGELDLVNVIGQVLLHFEVSEGQNSILTGTELSNGIYFLRGTIGGKVVVSRVVIGRN